jgi:hypothetical protein
MDDTDAKIFNDTLAAARERTVLSMSRATLRLVMCLKDERVITDQWLRVLVEEIEHLKAMLGVTKKSLEVALFVLTTLEARLDDRQATRH